MRNVKIGTKLLVILLVCALVPIFLVTGLALGTMRGISKDSLYANVQLGTQTSEDSEAALMKQAEDYLLKIAREQAQKTDTTLFRVQSELTAMAGYMASLYAHPTNFAGRNLPLPNETENLVPASKYMLAPGTPTTPALWREVRLVSNAEYMLRPLQGENAMMSNVYLGTESGISYRFSASNAYDENYDARLRPWYTAAVLAKGKPIWTQTELDGYGIMCCTNAVAYYDTQGGLLGVIATDVTLEQMQADITSTKIGQTGYAFLVDQHGQWIAHPDLLAEKSTPALPPVAFAGENGLVQVQIDGTEYYMAYHQLPVTSWYFAIVAEVNEIIGPALATRQTINSYIEQSQAGIESGLMAVSIQFIVVIAAATLLILLVAFFLSRTITTPVHSLLRAVEEIGRGNLDKTADDTGRDEISDLGAAFNNMAKNLKGQLLEVERVTAEKEKLNAEISVAARIQTGMVPSVFPAFPNRADFDIFAEMHPAKTVGGDFYDFYLLDAEHLCVCIADVSGKGVPAALFMARAKALLQSGVLSAKDLPQALCNVNEQLARGNDENMFVTVFMAVLNTGTGELAYVNAGHNPPLIRRNGTYSQLAVEKSMVLGGMPNTRYSLFRSTLQEGDSLFMYTDGVTEAMDSDGTLYGESRLAGVLSGVKGGGPRAQSRAVCNDIALFAAGVQQADDITILILERTSA